MGQAVYPLEMFEEQDGPLEVRRLQFAVDAVERMRDRVRDALPLQKILQIENVVAHRNDLGVLRLRNSPDQDVDLAGIMREKSRDLFAEERPFQVRDLEIAHDRVVIGDGDK